MSAARDITSFIEVAEARSREHSPSSQRQSYRRLLQSHNSIFQWFEYALYLAAAAGPLLAFQSFGNAYVTPHNQYVLVVSLLLMMIIYPMFGIGRRRVTGLTGLARLGKAWGSVMLALAAIGFLTKSSGEVSRLLMALWVVSSFCLQGLVAIVCYRLCRYFHKVSSDRCNSVIVGSGDIIYHLAQKMSGNVWLDEKLIAVCDFSNSQRSYELASDVRSIFSYEDLSRLIEQKEVRRVYIALSMRETPQLMEQFNALKDKMVDIVWVPDIYELELLNHCVREMAGLPLIALNETPHYSGARNFIKSAMDKVAAAVLILLLSPVLATIALLVKRSSEGPVVFKQERDGFDGRTFNVYKFRSMYVHQPDAVVRQATRDDPRVTPIGAFLRRTSLDELPQLFNVLFGTMSLVGPRPHAVSHNDYYSDKIGRYMSRGRVKPGMTGLAQIRGFRGETTEIEDMEARVRCDLEYINSWSPLLDLKILLLTPVTLLSKKAY